MRQVRDHVESEFALTKGIDVASACSALPPRLQIEIFFHLNRKQVLHVPLFARLPTEWVDAMVMQLQFSFFVAGSVVIKEESVSDACAARGIQPPSARPTNRSRRPRPSAAGATSSSAASCSRCTTTW